MKTLKVFSLVIVLHMALVMVLALQPGCKTVSRDTSANQTATPVGDGTRSGMWVLNENAAPAQRATAQTRRSTTSAPVTASRAYSDQEHNQQHLEIKSGSNVTAAVYEEGNDHREYQVERGDSLWMIARKHGVNMRTLMSFNGLNENDRIHPGQMLLIPGAGSSTAVASRTPEAPRPQPTAAPAPKAPPEVVLASAPVTKPVEKSVETPVVAENRASARAVESANVYEVQPGDSLFIIAMQNNTSVDRIRELNGLNSNLIMPGQRIKLPGKQEVRTNEPIASRTSLAAASTSFNEVPVASGQERKYLEHEVAPGEFPGLIARKYNMNVADLLHLNDIRNPRMLQVGTRLKVVNPEHLARDASSSVVAEKSEARSDEAITVRSGNTDSSSDEARDVSTINFDDFPVIRVGS